MCDILNDWGAGLKQMLCCPGDLVGIGAAGDPIFPDLGDDHCEFCGRETPCVNHGTTYRTGPGRYTPTGDEQRERQVKREYREAERHERE